MENTARRLAYDVLMDIQINEAYANLALDKAFLNFNLNQNDRRLATEIVYGCTKMRLHLDQIIRAYCDLKKIDVKTLTILRMAVYQLEFLEKIPDHAVINEAVELSKNIGLRSDKFINGVLRNICRNSKEVTWPNKRKQRNQYFSKWYSFPQWMIDSWVKEYGFADTEKLCVYFNSPAHTWIRVNALKTTPEQVMNELDALQIDYKQHQSFKEAIRVSSLQKVRESKLFEKGFITVQDLSAMIPAMVLNPQKNMHILDMCAAPGGKTTQLSAIMKNSGDIIACDLHSHRVRLIEHNAQRLGAFNIQCISGDVNELPEAYHHRFDGILLDAPCSGLGVLNRRADLRWHMRRSSLKEIEMIQENLLDSASKYLKPSGTLVYSTCTLNKKENEDQIKKFLEKNPEFELSTFEYFGEECEKGYKTIYPYIDQSDGFFIAKLVRKGL